MSNMTGSKLQVLYPDVDERIKVWLDMGYDAPVVQNAFPELDADKREVLILKSRGMSDEEIEYMMEVWKKIEETEE